ncbi:MAG: protocatechuate 3,4-dioxygenase subunit alpha [Vicinamibacterales bacterium]
MEGATPFQTAGPYLRIGLRAGLRPMRLAGGRSGTPIAVRGRLLDGAGEGIADGALEFWHPAFVEVGRVLTERDGGFRLQTVKPPPGSSADEAPHFAVRVLGRGILTEYLTRMYFDDEPATPGDQVLARVPSARRRTLIATSVGEGEYHLDIVVQGERETVFFDPMSL